MFSHWIFLFLLLQMSPTCSLELGPVLPPPPPSQNAENILTKTFLWNNFPLTTLAIILSTLELLKITDILTPVHFLPFSIRFALPFSNCFVAKNIIQQCNIHSTLFFQCIHSDLSFNSLLFHFSFCEIVVLCSHSS